MPSLALRLPSGNIYAIDSTRARALFRVCRAPVHQVSSTKDKFGLTLAQFVVPRGNGACKRGIKLDLLEVNAADEPAKGQQTARSFTRILCSV